MVRSERTPDAEAAAHEIEELWSAYSAQLTSYARRRASDLDADEVVASVFEATFRTMRAGNGPVDHPRAYLFAALKREIIRERERRSRVLTLDPDEADGYGASGHGRPGAGSGEALLDDILSEYREDDRHLILAVFAENRPLGEVAPEVGRTGPSASRRLYKLRSQLRADWIQRHVRTDGAPEACLPYLRNTGAVLAGRRSDDGERAFWLHVDSCASCRERVAEAASSSRSLSVLLPLLISVPAVATLAQPEGQPRDTARVSRPAVVTASALATSALLAGSVAFLSMLTVEERPEATPPDTSSEQTRVARESAGEAQEESTEATKPLKTCTWSATVLCNIDGPQPALP